VAVAYDPADRAVVVRRFSDRALEAGVEYVLRVDGVTDVAGDPVAPFEVRFTTGAEDVPREDPPPPSWAEVAPVLDGRCATAGCHDATTAAVGLDLSSGDGVERTALGVIARQTGPRAAAPPRGLTGMPIVDVQGDTGRPGSSYLIYKILGAAEAPGEPMPPDRDGWTSVQTRLLADWIAGGAPTR